MTQRNLWDDKCEWDVASGTCEEPVYYALTYCNESNALMETNLCFHHAMELSRDKKIKIFVVDKFENEEE